MLSSLSSTWRMMPLRDRRWMAWLLAAHFAVCAWHTAHQSMGCDEPGYFAYVLRWAKGNPDKIQPLDDSKSPAVWPALAVMPLKWLSPDMSRDYGAPLVAWARLPMYGYTLMMLAIAGCWLFRWLGSGRWLMPWLLLMLDPQVIANSMLVGTDMAATACALASSYGVWRFAQSRQMRYWWLFSLSAGWGVVVKLSMAWWIPLLMLCLLMASLRERWYPGHGYLRQWLIRWAGFVLVVGLVLQVAWYGSGTGRPLLAVAWQSSQMNGWLQRHPGLAQWPLPVPQPFVQGYDLALRNAERGGGGAEDQTYRGVFVNGKVQSVGGYWYYYLWQFLWKWPLLLWLLLLMAAIRRVRNGAEDWRGGGMVFLLLPAALWLVWLSLYNPFQIGVRHALPVWPALYLSVAPAVVWLAQSRPALWRILLLLHVVSLASCWPNLTAYTNEWSQPKSLVYRRISDSGLYYCTDEKIYRRFLQRHPEYASPPPRPEAGRFAVRLSEFPRHDATDADPGYWILRHMTPAGHHLGSILLFHVTEQDLTRAGLISGDAPGGKRQAQ